MPKKNIIYVIVSLFLLVLMLSGCSGSAANLSIAPVLAADKSEATATDGDLQQRLDKAKDGDKITIEAGTYNIKEPLKIEGKKVLTIMGKGDVIILGENIDMQIFIVKDCGSVTFDNIRARHKSNEGAKETKVFEKRSGSVVDVGNVDKAAFVNCELEGCGVYGIYTENTTEVDITGCYIHHNSWKAFGFHAGSGVTNVYIKGSTITHNADYLEKEGRVNITLEGENVIKFNNKEGYQSGR